MIIDYFCCQFRFLIMKLTKILCFLVAAVAAVTVFAKQPKNKTKYGVYVA